MTEAVVAHVKKTGNRERALEDVLWAVMNSKEFLLGE
jgi:hypothetical protein